MKLLLIDDEEAFGPIIQELVCHEFPGSTVKQVPACTNGIAEIEASEYDAILLDLTLLVGKQGLECLREIRESNKSVPIVIITGTWSEHLRSECLEAGADYYVPKCSMVPVLIPAITIAIEKRSALKSDFSIRRRARLAEISGRIAHI